MRKRIRQFGPIFLLTILIITLLTACGHEHVYSAWSVEKEATCTEDGLKVRICECGEKEAENLPAVGHDEGEWIVEIEATCTKDGSKSLICTVCDDIIETETVEANHKEGSWVVDIDATCTREGQKHLVCSVCKDIIETEAIAATGHKDGEWVVATKATCTKEGKKQLVCSVCKDIIETEAIAATGHKDGEWVVATKATCTKEGKKQLVCSVCKDIIETEAIAATGHKDGEWVVATKATCTKEGKKQLVCSVCKDIIETEAIAATGHKDGEWVVATKATCTKEGKKQLVCSVCKDIIETEAIAATGHEASKWTVVTEATCSNQGSKQQVCTTCNTILKVEEFTCKIYTSTEIYEQYLKSVGEIITYDKNGQEYALGTCFVYTDDGKIITNYHVIEGAYSASITINGSEYKVKKVLAYDKNIDIAVLQISSSKLTPAKLCEHSHKVGEIVYALGSSKGLTATFSDGMITYSDRRIDGVSYTQHDAPISSGNSGGPLINKYGEVIGINTWTVRESQNLNFAINVSELKNLYYGAPMTMEEFYQKECDPFTKLKNYIIENGSYSSANDWYEVELEVFYSDDYTMKFTRYAYYYVDENIVTLDLTVNGGDIWAYFEIDENIDGSYWWCYFDDRDNKMSGTLYATTYDEDTLLGYDSNNISSSTTRNYIRELASTMVSIICSEIDDDFYSIGVTAADLHFYCY